MPSSLCPPHRLIVSSFLSGLTPTWRPDRPHPSAGWIINILSVCCQYPPHTEWTGTHTCTHSHTWLHLSSVNQRQLFTDVMVAVYYTICLPDSGQKKPKFLEWLWRERKLSRWKNNPPSWSKLTAFVCVNSYNTFFLATHPLNHGLSRSPDKAMTLIRCKRSTDRDWPWDRQLYWYLCQHVNSWWTAISQGKKTHIYQCNTVNVIHM